jgi:hypothetical protein
MRKGLMKWTANLGTVLLPALLACEDGFLVIRTGVFASGGFVTCVANGADWNATSAHGSLGHGIVIIFGTGWDQFHRQIDIQLSLRTTVGSSAQVIGGDDVLSAEVMVYDYGQTRTWSAGSTQGSGIFKLTSLSAESVSGTFEFAAPATGQSMVPATYRIARGTFSVPLR